MSTSLLAEIPSSMVASLEAAEGREVRGILFKILVADLKGARVPGAVAETTSEEAGGQWNGQEVGEARPVVYRSLHSGWWTAHGSESAEPWLDGSGDGRQHKGADWGRPGSKDRNRPRPPFLNN